MKYVTLFILLITTSFVAAQDSTRVTTIYNQGTKNEDYHINQEGQKSGKYMRYTRYGNVYIDGQYKNGVPVGVWNYYTADTAGKLLQTLNFDTHQETFVDSVNVPSLVCGPRYFGGNMAKQEYVQMRIASDFTPEERKLLKGKSVLAVFSIDPVNYTTVGITVDDKTIGESVRSKIVRIVEEMPAWLAPVCKGSDPVWRMSVVFLFQ
jgi:hypothetical protein